MTTEPVSQRKVSKKGVGGLPGLVFWLKSRPAWVSQEKGNC
jgi:hypothetical protein